MLPRVLAGAAAAWTVAYLVAYFWVIDAQDGAVVWWYVVLMVLAALSFALAAVGIRARAALIVGLVTAAFAMLIALLSLGALLAPTVAAAAIALVVARRGPPELPTSAGYGSARAKSRVRKPPDTSRVEGDSGRRSCRFASSSSRNGSGR